MLTLLSILAVLALARAHKLPSSDSSSSSEAGLSSTAAIAEAERLIANAQVLKAQGLLRVDDELIGSGNIGLQGDHTSSSSSSSSSSSNHSDDDDDGHGRRDSSSSHSTELSTSDRLNIAVEERLIEAAIQQAFQETNVDTVQKKAYQARYEISAFDGDEFLTDELQFGPTVISTRHNFFLENSGQCQWWTMGDFLDKDQNGEPDILVSLRTFRDTNNPAPFLQMLRNRATAVRDGTIQLINLIQLDGRFSQTNQLVSSCFSATNQEEFVFETVVGVAPGQTGVLTANPTQTESILLAASSALDPTDPLKPFEDDKNRFVDDDNGRFVETLELPLYINLVPDQLEPGADVVAQQGTVFFTACSAFSYFE